MTTANTHSLEPRDLQRLLGKVVVFEGTPGNGKSTAIIQLRAILKEIAPSINVVCLEENVDIALMKSFYADPRLYAFPFQMAQMKNCLAVVREAGHIMREDPTALIFVERSPCGNKVFETANRLLGNISERDHVLYMKKWKKTSDEWNTDLNVLLSSDVDATLERIKARNRPGETIDRGYVTLLKNLHDDEFLNQQSDCKCAAKKFNVQDADIFTSYYHDLLRFICRNV